MRGAELVDLSVPVETGMPVYPGDPEVVVAPALTVAADGVNVSSVHLGTHSGTHVDAPFHIDAALPSLDALPLTRFTGTAAVLDARDLPPRTPVTPDRLPPGLEPGTVLLVMTGWSGHWGTDAYNAHPYLTRATAEAIIATGVRTVGIDALSVDPTPPPDEDTFTLDAHRALLGAHAVIVENLTALHRVHAAAAAEVFLFPLNLSGDGAPTRAVARLT